MQTGLFLIDKRDLDDMWPGLQTYIYSYRKGIPKVYDPGELYAEIRSNPDFHIWVLLKNSVLEGVFIASFARTNIKTSMWIIAINSHNLKDYLQYMPDLEKWAMQMGAQDVAFEGTPGWERLLQKRSYYAKTKVYRKDVMKAWSN